MQMEKNIAQFDQDEKKKKKKDTFEIIIESSNFCYYCSLIVYRQEIGVSRSLSN